MINYEKILKEYNYQNLSKKILEKMIKDRKVRIAICKQSFYGFFHLYFAHYVKYKTAAFQREIFYLVENKNDKNLFIVAFRSSGKSTILTTAYPLWAILGKQQKKFALLLCQTQSQAKMHMMSLRRELEENVLLKSDLGPFKEESNEWGISSVVFSKINSRITVASTEQSIRGLRHNQYRPDIIICDDVESIASTRTREGRQKTHQWLTGEVIPAGDKNTRLIVVGNLLHKDSLLMRLKEDLERNKINGIFKEYPLFDDNGIVAWPGKYPSEKDIEKEKRRVGDEIAWQREYLLQIIPNTEKIVNPKWIKKYRKMPSFDSSNYKGTYVSIDPAVSEKEDACKTAMVIGSVFGEGIDKHIFIHSNTINKRMTLYEIEKTAKSLCYSFGKGIIGIPIIEDVGAQKWLYQSLSRKGLPTEAYKVKGMSKEIRLKIAASQIQAGRVSFPEYGAEELLEQILDFGIEKYNDLADAFSALICSIMENEREENGFLGYIRKEAENFKKENTDSPKSPTAEDYLKQKIEFLGYYGSFDIK